MAELFYRSIQTKQVNIDEKRRTMTVSFSSEFPAKRYLGDEILLHGEKNVDLDYLNKVGSVLDRHGGGLKNIVGPVHRAWIDNRRGNAEIGFDDDETGNLALQKIKAGSLRGISFGYRIEKGIRLDDETEVWVDPETKTEYRGPAVIGTFWRAHEITLTPIPVDHTVGFSRSLVKNIYFENLKKSITEGKTMDEKEIKELIEKTVKDAVRGLQAGPSLDDIVNKVRGIIKEETTPKIQVDRDTLADISSRAAAVSESCKSKVFDMALGGRSHVEMLNFINDEATRSDAAHRDPAGDGHHDNKKGKDQGTFRSINDIPDELFIGAMR